MTLRIFCCSVFRDRTVGKPAACSLKRRPLKKGVAQLGDSGAKSERRALLWGCSSAGRAPALQAGGHGFDSHHLHHFFEKHIRRMWISKNDENGVNRSHSYPAGYEEHAKARRTRKREIARVWVLIPIISTRSNRESQMRNGL